MHMTNYRVRRWFAALPACGIVALSACSTQADLRKTELTALALQLPGDYDNARQALAILRLAAPLVGDQVFYVRETAGDDARRVISERIWSLDVAAGHIVGAVYAFDEPERWRGGADNPQLFRSLLMRDLRPLAGCAQLWQKSVHGFSAESASASCRRSWRLEGDELSFSEHAPGVADPFFHLTRRSGAQ